jgi:hypothetical protein
MLGSIKLVPVTCFCGGVEERVGTLRPAMEARGGRRPLLLAPARRSGGEHARSPR